MRDATLILGHYSLILALFAAGWATVSSSLGAIQRGRGLQISAQRAVWTASALTALATVCLVKGFLTDDFRLDAVYFYSSTSQAIQYKVGALWGGQAGSLLLWLLILCVLSSIFLWTNRAKHRALMPWATAVLAATITFFLILVTFVEPPFKTGAARPDGLGLNPQLKSYWMMIHPPMLYLGYVGFSIPFAVAIAALATRRTGDVWFRTTRRWTLFAWFFLAIGILLGAYWAYIELGWGGYWAWDPVENASLMPWLTGTAFLHSVMLQERKGMLKVWNMLLIILTFSLSIFGTFLTRSGVISSVHAFATSDIGPAFGIFLFIVFFGALLLLITRLDSLKSEARLESVLSRESSFLFNNLIFVGITATVLLLTTFPMLSELATGQKVTTGPPIFNLVNVPWALALLLLTGIGPLIAWRKATSKNLRRNFLVPTLLGAWVLLGLLFIDARVYLAALGALLRSIGALDIVGALDQIKTFYPALTFAIGAFVVATVMVEFYRGTRVRRRNRGESLPVAVARLVWSNKRRYGGYIVHVGVVLVFIGIAASSAYRHEEVRMMRPGEMLVVDDYYMRYEGYHLEAVDDHVGAVAEVSVFDRHSGDRLAILLPEQRYHPNMLFADLRAAFRNAKQLGALGAPGYADAVARVYQIISVLETRAGREVKTPSTEVAILSSMSPFAPSRFGEDFYVTPLFIDPTTGQANFRIFVNPMVNFLWLGGLVFVIGAHLAVFPDARERQRLAGSLALEEQAVA